MKMQRPSLIIFDMDDVLGHYHVGIRFRMLAGLADVTARDVRAALWDSGFEDDADSGVYPDGAEYLKEFSRRLGKDITETEWVETRRAAMEPNLEMLALAEKLKAQAEIAIFTNNGPLVKKHFTELVPQIAAVFEKRYCSYETGLKKPDPACFTTLMTMLGRKAETCFFTDDKKSNAEGAAIAGLHAHHFTQISLLEDALKNLGFAV